MTGCRGEVDSGCPHEVTDHAATLPISTEQACGVLHRDLNSPSTEACRAACGDSTVTYCSVSSDFVTAFLDANPYYLADGGDSTCPSAPDGGQVVLSCTASHTEGTYQSGCVINGRRPDGLASSSRAPDDSVLGRYFAECAHLEAASVVAFDVMRKDLAAHGAPSSLIDAADRAARDEERHAASIAALASRFGASPAALHVASRRDRSLVEIARENVVEGVVRETFGAAAALWSAEHARDEQVRRAMRAIAEEECAHAAFSWEVAAWARSRLDVAERRALDEAMASAIAELRRDLAASPTPVISETAGVPTAAEAARLLALIEANMWAPSLAA